jgi:hypothetical protein
VRSGDPRARRRASCRSPAARREIIITAGGKNIAPKNIEAAIKT